MKKFLILPLAACTLMCGLVGTKGSFAAPSEDENILYYADFENAVVSSTIPPDKVTDFIWAQEYLDCKTTTHDGSTMLYLKAASKTNDFTTFGGFGTSAHSNLGKLRQGEPYHVETYLDFGNVDYVEVEAVCGDEKWGAIKVYPDGSLKADAGGNNMVDVSYKNKILSFKFTYSFNEHEGVNGYLTFKAFNSNNGYCYLDNCKIEKSLTLIDGTFDEYPVGTFDCRDDRGLRTILYGGSTEGITSAIVNESNNKFVRFTYDSTSNDYQEIFYFNKMQFMNLNRINTFSFNLATTNVESMQFIYGGTWAQETNKVTLDVSGSSIQKSGERILDATYLDGVVTIKFKSGRISGLQAVECYQFQVLVKANEGDSVTIDVDNTRVTQEPELSQITVDATGVKKTYNYGDSFTYENIVITGTNTDGSTCSINPDDCTYTGYDMNAEGKQIVTVTYQTFTDTYSIRVNRVLSSLNIDTTNVKKTYGYGESLDLTGLVVTVTYTDSTEEVRLQHDALSRDGYAVFAGDFNSRKVGEYNVTVIYKHLQKSFKVTVSFTENYNFEDISYGTIGGK